MKKVISVLLVMATMLSFTVSAFASDAGIVAQIEAGIDRDRFTVCQLSEEDVPNQTVPIKFDSVEEAIDWVNSLEKPSLQARIDVPGHEWKGDVGWLGMAPIPSGSGSKTYTLEYEVPGLSAQVVTAEHYFEYANNRVVDWAVYTETNGIGLITFKETYTHLERHDVDYARQYFGVCVGDLGYYISVGGANIGIYEQLELTQGLYYHLG